MAHFVENATYPDCSPLGVAFNAVLYRNEVHPVDDAEETQRLLTEAADGSSDALVRLVHAVGATIRRLHARNRALPREEFDSAVSLALLEAIHECDFSDSTSTAPLGDMLYRKAQPALAPATAGTIQVPHRTMQRYFSIEKAAKKEADAAGVVDHVYIALRIAADHGMSPSVYLDVRAALSAMAQTQFPKQHDPKTGEVIPLETLIENAAARFMPAEIAEDDEVLAARALSAVSEDEAKVCYIAYGFGREYCKEADNNPRSDAEVGERLGLSRQKAQRTRTGALGKMRAALLADA